MGAQSGIASDIAPGEAVSGTPAMPHADWLRSQAALRQLPDLRREVKELRRELDRLRAEREGKS